MASSNNVKEEILMRLVKKINWSNPRRITKMKPRKKSVLMKRYWMLKEMTKVIMVLTRFSSTRWLKQSNLCWIPSRIRHRTSDFGLYHLRILNSLTSSWSRSWEQSGQVHWSQTQVRLWSPYWPSSLDLLSCSQLSASWFKWTSLNACCIPNVYIGSSSWASSTVVVATLILRSRSDKCSRHRCFGIEKAKRVLLSLL